MKYSAKSEIRILIDDKSIHLTGNLTVPEGAESIVVFAHGHRSDRFSPRNNYVAHALNGKGIATLLIDLLSPEEDEVFDNRFDIDLLTNRLIAVTGYIREWSRLSKLRIGYFGSSTGAAAALKAGAHLNEIIDAIVSRGGRTDLAETSLLFVEAPTLFIVGGLDTEVIQLNQKSFRQLNGENKLAIIDGATHLFTEAGKLEKVADLATAWFDQYLGAGKQHKLESKTHAL